MGIRNSILDWFIRNYIVTNHKNYKSPGFIIVSFTIKNREIFFREVLFPEKIIVQLENEIVRLYGEKGRKALYQIGIDFGYAFANLFGVPNLKDNNINEVKRYSKIAFKFNFSTWCKQSIIQEEDLEHEKVTLVFKDHIICRENGLGTIITEGSQSGFGKYLLNNPNLEVVQTKCMGRGDDFCCTIWRKPEDFKEMNIDYIAGNPNYLINDFLIEKKYNSIQPSRYAKKSTYDMLNGKIFNLRGGQIFFKEQLFFDCTVILYYLLELYLSKNEGTKNLLFDIGFKYGQNLAKNEKLNFIPQILSALGWGDTLISKNKSISIQIFYFPWSCLINEKLDFLLFKGILSGMLTSTLKRKVIIKKHKELLKNDFLVMSFSES